MRAILATLALVGALLSCNAAAANSGDRYVATERVAQIFAPDAHDITRTMQCPPPLQGCKARKPAPKGKPRPDWRSSISHLTTESGMASVYAVPGKDVYAGRKSASGERVQPGALVAAHKTLPFGTTVRVTNKRNGKSAVVRIIDRGPFVRGRIIDVTPAGARALGFSGLAPVSIARL
jgi:rare lipoprotein A